ncbi:MAG: hypothetical protein ACOH2J_16815 [Allorhizobium sp.]
MKNSIRYALAGLITISSMTGVAVARDMTKMAGEGVTIVYISSLNDRSSQWQYNALRRQANNPAIVAAARAEIASDATLRTALANESVQLNNVVTIDTAANGGKIVYIR